MQIGLVRASLHQRRCSKNRAPRVPRGPRPCSLQLPVPSRSVHGHLRLRARCGFRHLPSQRGSEPTEAVAFCQHPFDSLTRRTRFVNVCLVDMPETPRYTKYVELGRGGSANEWQCTAWVAQILCAGEGRRGKDENIAIRRWNYAFVCGRRHAVADCGGDPQGQIAERSAVTEEELSATASAGYVRATRNTGSFIVPAWAFEQHDQQDHLDQRRTHSSRLDETLAVRPAVPCTSTARGQTTLSAMAAAKYRVGRPSACRRPSSQWYLRQTGSEYCKTAGWDQTESVNWFT
jgi:hypothetical protein